MSGKLRKVVELVGMALITPAIVGHEATHYIAARDVATAIGFDADPVQPAVLVEWDTDAPLWRIKLAKVAPTIVGLCLAPMLLWAILHGQIGVGPVSLILLGWWVVYTFPSAGDLSQPMMAGTGQSGVNISD